jgi:hypothetical protein
MTRPAEGVAAEHMAEVGVGTPAVTSGAAFAQEHVRVQVVENQLQVDSPEQDYDDKSPPFRPLSSSSVETRYKAVCWVAFSGHLTFQADVSSATPATNERRSRGCKGLETTNSRARECLEMTTNKSRQRGGPKAAR